MMFSSHGFLRFCALVVPLHTCILLGCASAPAPVDAMSSQIRNTADDFYRAVAQKSAGTVYDMLDPDWRSQFADEAEFEVFFVDHYDSFVEYARGLVEDTRPIQYVAQFHGDPCGSYQLVPDQNGDWKIARFADGIESEEAQKAALLALVTTGRFRQSLGLYGNLHPELSKADMRHILRVLTYDDIATDAVEFTTNHAIITIPHTARIRMVCEDSTWSIAECSALP